LNRRTFIKRGAAAVAASGFGCFGYALFVEPHWLEIVTRDLPIHNLPRHLEGARLVQISDLHVGPRVSDQYVIASFERIRALSPDIIVVTGDFIGKRTLYISRGVGHLLRARFNVRPEMTLFTLRAESAVTSPA
jgi:predicted MPP superfamily phosphohydrolase